MSIGDIVYYAFWWSVAGIILVLFVLPLASFMFTIVASMIALQIGLMAAVVGYIVGIPWAIYRRIVDGEWPEG